MPKYLAILALCIVVWERALEAVLQVRFVGSKNLKKLLQYASNLNRLLRLCLNAAQSLCLVGLLGRIYRVYKPSCLVGK